MASKNGSGQRVLSTDPTAAAAKKPEIPRKIRNLINSAFGDDLLDQKKEVLKFINDLLKNQKPAD